MILYRNRYQYDDQIFKIPVICSLAKKCTVFVGNRAVAYGTLYLYCTTFNPLFIHMHAETSVLLHALLNGWC